MDLRLPEAEPTPAERAAVDARLGPATSAWHGADRAHSAQTHHGLGGEAFRQQRHLLLPALQSLQERIGWLSEGGMGYVCRRLGIPPAEAYGVATFYALLATSPRPRRVLHVCDDIGCRERGAKQLIDRLGREHGPAIGHAKADRAMDLQKPGWLTSPCLGLCDSAPAALLTQAGEQPLERSLGAVSADQALALLADANPAADALLVPRPQPSGIAGAPLVLLQRIGQVDPESLADYRAAEGYRALTKALELGPEAVVAEISASKLLGRGGAAFPTGRKWDAVRRQPAQPHYLVCNADESEPGTFKDRVLLVHDPFAIVEAMTIAGYATGCQRGYLYLRAEYPLAHARMRNAIEAARQAGLLGTNILGSGFEFDIEIRRGAGAYICGEETAIFESIEGKRGEPRNKPPFPVQVGLFGKPTVVNNVETLANVPWILRHGAAEFTRLGTQQSTGTRLFCLSGSVRNPGVYEVPYGTTLGAVIDLAGGVSKGKIAAVLLGGAAGGFVGADEMQLRLTHEDTRAAGAALGSGVVMVFDDSADLGDAVLRIAAFFRDESCGQCVPCRVGTVRQEEALQRIARGKPRGGLASELALLDEIGQVMRDGSICGLGHTAYAAVESAIKRLRIYAKHEGRT